MLFTYYISVGDYIKTLPYFCDFEDGYCNMIQSIDDKFEWRRYQKPPASFRSGQHYTGDSGPVIDHTLRSGSGSYS